MAELSLSPDEYENVIGQLLSENQQLTLANMVHQARAVTAERSHGAGATEPVKSDA